jgi:N-acetylated-alpha-linked acidic dipeptidase
MRHGDDDFRRGALLARILGTAAIRLAEAPVLPYRFSYYGKKLEDFARQAEEWSAGRNRFERLKELAAAVREKGERLEAALDSGPLPADVEGLNDRLMRLEQSLIDESAPPEERWYRHVVYGWNIYSLLGSGLSRSRGRFRAGTEEDVGGDERLENALERLGRGLDALNR